MYTEVTVGEGGFFPSLTVGFTLRYPASTGRRLYQVPQNAKGQTL